MISVLFAELVVVVGVRRACILFGVSRAGHYRSCQPLLNVASRPRRRPANALTDEQAAEVLEVLRSPEHCELAPAPT